MESISGWWLLWKIFHLQEALTSTSCWDENCLENLDLIKPVSMVLDCSGSQFEWVYAAH
jgi:hypothetical protein